MILHIFFYYNSHNSAQNSPNSKIMVHKVINYISCTQKLASPGARCPWYIFVARAGRLAQEQLFCLNFFSGLHGHVVQLWFLLLSKYEHKEFLKSAGVFNASISNFCSVSWLTWFNLRIILAMWFLESILGGPQKLFLWSPSPKSQSQDLKDLGWHNNYMGHHHISGCAKHISGCAIHP